MQRRNFIQHSALSLPVLAGLSFQSFGSKQQNLTIGDYRTDKPIQYNLNQVPFTYHGSFINIENHKDGRKNVLKINTIRKTAISHKWQNYWANELFELFVEGNDEITEYVSHATYLQLKGTRATLMITFVDKETIQIKAQNCSFKLIPKHPVFWKYESPLGYYCLFDFSAQNYFYCYNTNGNKINILEKNVDNTFDTIVFEENAEAILKISRNERIIKPITTPIEETIKIRNQEWTTWLSKKTIVADTYESASIIGWYIFWTSIVGPEENYTRKTILSGRKNLSEIWSWDNFFSALAVADADYDLAWQQLLLFADHQDKSGAFPDTINDMKQTIGFNKPPLWGWAIKKLIKKTPPKQIKSYVAQMYKPVCDFTNWWFNYRDFNKNGIPAYVHGNDSGWDNSTLYDHKAPFESPDLSTYLIIQMETLAEMATILGKKTEAIKWKEQAQTLLQKFHDHFFIKGELVYYETKMPQSILKKSTSLLTRMSVLLGKRLKPEVISYLVSELSRDNYFLCPSGIASESITSPKYESKGYWRGPVWGPTTYLIVDGLIELGEVSLAKTIATRYCDTINKEATFRENYDAITGEGNDDGGMTWAASDFLLLAKWLNESK
jgi:putative isomerase